jgi:OOP family OmpA-OmpF porin
MKKLNKVASLFAAVAFALTATAVTAQTAAPAEATKVDNWVNPNGLPWKNGTNELCWRDANWTPATALPGCDGAPKPEPKAAPEAPAAAAVVPPAPVVPMIISEKVTFAADAFFDFDKAVLKPEGKAKLDEVVTKLNSINLEVIIAVGHTDSVGSDAYNEKLSVRRAEAVKADLVGNSEARQSLDDDADHDAEHGGAAVEELNALELIHEDLPLGGFLKTVLTRWGVGHGLAGVNGGGHHQALGAKSLGRLRT